MIILGTRHVLRTTEHGAFFCPQCTERQAYARRSVRRAFAILNLPVVPLGHLVDFIECLECEGTFEVAVLEFDPREQQREVEAQWREAVTRVMIRMMLADGRVDDEEVLRLRGIHQSICGREIAEAELLERISAVEAGRGDLEGDLREIAPMLNEHGKELVVKAALAIAAADGELGGEEKLLMDRLARALHMSHAHFGGILAEAREGGPGAP